MFNKDFYPTPENVIEQMLNGYNVQDKICLEPSAGKGNIVDFLISQGADVIACEKNEDLKKIVSTKCRVISDDFFTVKSEQVSHVDFIIMNPPFSADEKHINHAWEIAPAGCKIIALCNLETIESCYTAGRRQLKSIVSDFGSFIDLGNCFSDAERKTGVEVALIRLEKPGAKETEWDGFFLEEDPVEEQYNGIMPYNFIRDLVNRYINAMKIYDEQLETAARMNDLTHEYFFAGNAELSLSISRGEVPIKRAEFKKAMQKSGWLFIFNKMNMNKYATKGLKEDINKFVEQHQEIPFTMQNIYRMLEIVIGTQSQRMDKSLEEVFDRVTRHHDENRYNVEGWKSNSHYLLNQKFVMPYMCPVDKWHSGTKVSLSYGSSFELIEDMMKALCHITGDNYDNKKDLRTFMREHVHYGELYTWEFFEIRCFKKGTMHFKFKDLDLWGKFNQHIARIKGYPLYEYKEKKKQHATAE